MFLNFLQLFIYLLLELELLDLLELPLDLPELELPDDREEELLTELLPDDLDELDLLGEYELPDLEELDLLGVYVDLVVDLVPLLLVLELLDPELVLAGLL